MRVKVSNLVADFLFENGIEHCFMVTGGGAMHLDDAIGHKEGIHCIFNHHEQASAIAAEAYTRMTGKLCAVCVTSGPGGTNAITGVLGGWLDSVPMFILSGQVKRETLISACPDLGLRQLGDQEHDIVNTVRNLTKYAVMISAPNEILYHLEKALYLSKEGRGGPVWLDIPLDVQGAYVETEELVHFSNSDEIEKPKITKDTIDFVIEKIKNAKAPLVLAGTGINLGNAREELLEFLRKYRIPVVTAWNANDTVSFDNDYYVGMPGTVGTRAGNFAVQNCDVLISLGCRMNIRMIGYNHFDFAKNAYKIAIDIDDRELKKPTVKIDYPVCGDVTDFLTKMNETEYVPEEKHLNWVKWGKELLLRYPVVVDEYYAESEKTGRINPYVFTELLFAKLIDTDRIVCGNGSACVITFQAAKIKQGQRMFTNSGCAAMGYGLPAALGVAVSDNESRTICIDGDGSIMMNIQELATVKYNHLNLKIFVINNDGYLSIKQTQTNLFQPPLIGVGKANGICFPDFEKLADSFGLNYAGLKTISDVNDNLDTILNSKEPYLCEVFVDPNQFFAPKSASRVLPDGKIVSSSLDDMSPFLDREEYKGIKYI